MRSRIAILLAALLVFTACSGEKVPEKLDDDAATLNSVSDLVDGYNQFAFDLYNKIDGDDSNIFFSPYSIGTALTMTYEGAKGSTAGEIQEAFGFPIADDLRKASVASLYNHYNRDDLSYELSTANAFWVQDDFPLLAEFVAILQNHYGGEGRNVDFINATESARKEINAWVEEQTMNKIKDLFPEGVLNTHTRLVLTNAIYFKGNWENQFKKSMTSPRDFTLASGEEIEVETMRMNEDDGSFQYGENDDLQILSMPYSGDELVMTIVLPKGDLGSINFTYANLQSWKSEMRSRDVEVEIPKFTFTSKYPLNEMLESLGVVAAFTPPSLPGGADFSGINGEQNLYVQSAIHQAFVEVNEEGTEAAAATGVAVGIESAPMPSEPLKFHVDHPFIFLIEDTTNDSILFVGRMMDPRETEAEFTGEISETDDELSSIPDIPNLFDACPGIDYYSDQPFYEEMLAAIGQDYISGPEFIVDACYSETLQTVILLTNGGFELTGSPFSVIEYNIESSTAKITSQESSIPWPHLFGKRSDNLVALTGSLCLLDGRDAYYVSNSGACGSPQTFFNYNLLTGEITEAQKGDWEPRLLEAYNRSPGRQFEGSLFVTGYAEINEVPEAWCDEDCSIFDYVLFKVDDASSSQLAEFLAENQGNAFTGPDSIGLGCYQQGQIRYANQNNSEMRNYTVSPELSAEIITSTPENPITLLLTKEPQYDGGGAPTCYSHFTYIN